MPSSKLAILAAIRQSSVEPVELPDTFGIGIVYDDPVARFSEMVERVGGDSLRLPGWEDFVDALEELEVYQSAERILSQLPGVPRANVELDAIEDPREMNYLDLAILPGEFAVAENGAVWVTDRRINHRVVYVIAEHLILVVDASQVVHNLHQAYQRIRFREPGYGLFISGPSKTADIAASLVKGAQGPRRHHVVLVGDGPGT